MRHPRRLAAPLLLLVLATVGRDLAAEPLGRLFFSAERRAAMDRQRLLNADEIQTLEGASIRLDGVVRRSGGRNTIWVNQRPIQEDTTAAGVAVTVLPGDPTRARLTPDNEATATLKVGQSINRASRETSDGLGGGRVTVGGQTPPSPGR